jgi:hypothetical protein
VKHATTDQLVAVHWLQLQFLTLLEISNIINCKLIPELESNVAAEGSRYSNSLWAGISGIRNPVVARISAILPNIHVFSRVECLSVIVVVAED